MNKIIFLGTGPFEGVSGAGKSNRKESSIFIRASSNILIDVTNDFDKQSKAIVSPDAVLITHGHRDAMGGFAQMDKWLSAENKKISCYAHPKTIKIIKNRFKDIIHFKFISLKSGKEFRVGEIKIKPFWVKHSIQPGFPTFGFNIKFENKKILSYVSDTAEYGNRLEKNIGGSEILILDGALWNQSLPAHLDIKKIIGKVCKWRVGKIYFTQIGNDVPKYESLNKWLKSHCKKAFSAYDGLKINVGF